MVTFEGGPCHAPGGRFNLGFYSPSVLISVLIKDAATRGSPSAPHILRSDWIAHSNGMMNNFAWAQSVIAESATPSKSQKRLAPQVGLEPTTLRLTAGCSAIELLRSVVRLAGRHRRNQLVSCL